MDTITITVAENDPDVIVSATLNEDAVTITLNEAATGATGAGVPAGGSTNDILKKTSSTNYATAWETPTSEGTPNTIVRRDATGGVQFGGQLSTLGASSDISTSGLEAYIYTQGANAYIQTVGENAHIFTASPTASVKSYNFAALDATAGASLRNSAGTAYLTWGATAGNISITVDTISTGHFLSNPSTATAGHFLTKNGTAPTIIAGRSAWFSSSTGDPQFRNGTSSAVTLVYSGGALGTPISGTLTSCTGLPVSTGISGLGTNVAAFLATPSSANLLAALTTSQGTGSAVFATSPTLTTATASTASNTTPGLIISGPTSSVDTLQIKGTNTASYSSIGFLDSGGTQRGSFGYAGTTAGSFANTTFINSANGVRLTLGTNSTERISISTAGGVTIGTTTDAGATNLLVAGRITGTAGIVYGTFTVGTFPSTTYLEAVVTDSLAPVVGATVAAGGSAKCKVMYNGSAKIVTAVL